MMLLTTATIQTSSAQQPSAARQLIIHIDDAGLCHAANEATIKCLESGAVTSASVMMPCAWAAEFAAYAKSHPQYCYGIHFTLNAEWDNYKWQPVAGSSAVPSLVDSQGFMFGGVEDVAKNAKASEVETELRAQIEQALKMGMPISHFDTHMGSVMARPDLIAVYTKLALEYDKPILWLRTLDEEQQLDYEHLARALTEITQRLDGQKLPVLDSLLQFYGGDDLDLRKSTYLESIEGVRPGITQLIIHSAVDGPELKAITTSHARRHQDYELFSQPDMKVWVERQGIQLTSWKDLTMQLRSPN